MKAVCSWRTLRLAQRVTSVRHEGENDFRPLLIQCGCFLRSPLTFGKLKDVGRKGGRTNHQVDGDIRP